jgi:hypothetical protein
MLVLEQQRDPALDRSPVKRIVNRRSANSRCNSSDTKLAVSRRNVRQSNSACTASGK